MENYELNNLIYEQYEELNSKYKNLNLNKNSSGIWIIEGLLQFDANDRDKKISIQDEYNVKVTLENYPHNVPSAEEVGGRIPKDFHTNYDGKLCLTAPLEAKIKFKSCPTLTGFFENLLIPYLYLFSFKEKFGYLPYGEFSHGIKGILEWYEEFFNISSKMQILGLLRILADDDYRGHLDCPCESSKKIRQCHGKKLIEISKYQTPLEFLEDYSKILKYLLENNVKNIPKNFLSKNLFKILKRDPRARF